MLQYRLVKYKSNLEIDSLLVTCIYPNGKILKKIKINNVIRPAPLHSENKGSTSTAIEEMHVAPIRPLDIVVGDHTECCKLRRAVLWQNSEWYIFFEALFGEV